MNNGFVLELINAQGIKEIWVKSKETTVVGDKVGRGQPYADKIIEILSSLSCPSGWFKLRLSPAGLGYQVIVGKTKILYTQENAPGVFREVASAVYKNACTAQVEDFAEFENQPFREDILAFFPDEQASSLEERVQNNWEFVGGLPFPKSSCCPHCNNQVLIREWRFWQRVKSGSKHTGRCDVSFKCSGCSVVWMAGVVISQAHLEQFGEGKTFSWRQAKEYLLPSVEPADGS